MALVHEWLETVGGAEHVFWSLADLFPQADRWCLWDSRRDGGQAISETWLAHKPAAWSKAFTMPLMPIAWRTQRAPTYDVVLSSSHCFAHTVRFPSCRDAVYLSYVHSPARYLWTPELDHRGGGVIPKVSAPLLRTIDRRLGQHVAALAVNSHEVRDRVRRFWDRDATVIHPPVDVDYFAVTAGENPDLPAGVPGTFALTAGRWVPYKRFDAAIRASSAAGIPLVLAGGGPDEDRLRQVAHDAGSRVHVVRHPSRPQLRALYQKAAVFVFAAHEDFGIMPVEAQAAGTPVAGVAAGGLLETVLPGRTGVLAETADPQELADALLAAARLKGSLEPAQHAQRYTREAFYRSIHRWVESVVS